MKKNSSIIVVILIILLCIITNNHINTELTPLKVKTAIKKDDCYLCGKNSLMSYYEQTESIGLLYLNTFDLLDLRIRTYDDDGTLSTGSILLSSKQFAKGIRVKCRTISERSYATVDITMSGKNKYIDFNKLPSYLCRDCIDTVYDLDNPWNNNPPRL